MRQYKAYIFDLYGTLVDIHTDESKPGFWKKVAVFYGVHGAPYPPKQLRQDYLRLCAEETRRLTEDSGCTEQEVEIDLAPVFAGLYEAKGVQTSGALIADTAWFFRRASTTHLRAYAGARELLQGLRAAGKQVLLLSNAQALFTLPELEQLGLTDCFDAVYISSSCGFRKPAKQLIRRLLEEQQLHPDVCLMLGNDPNSDLAVANSVQMDSFYLKSATSPEIDPNHADARYTQAPINLRTLKKDLLHNEKPAER